MFDLLDVVPLIERITADFSFLSSGHGVPSTLPVCLKVRISILHIVLLSALSLSPSPPSLSLSLSRTLCFIGKVARGGPFFRERHSVAMVSRGGSNFTS